MYYPHFFFFGSITSQTEYTLLVQLITTIWFCYPGISLGHVSAAIAPGDKPDTVTASAHRPQLLIVDLPNAPAAPSSITTVLITAEVAPTRMAHLQEKHLVHPSTSSSTAWSYSSWPEAGAGPRKLRISDRAQAGAAEPGPCSVPVVIDEGR